MPRFQGDNLRHNLGLVEELKKHGTAERCTPQLAWFFASGLHRADPRHQPSTPARRKAAAVSPKISADIQDALLKVFVPSASSGLR